LNLQSSDYKAGVLTSLPQSLDIVTTGGVVFIVVVVVVSVVQVLAPLNMRLEDENQSLMIQLRGLMTQNQDLLTGLLNGKDRIITEDQRIYVYVHALLF